MNFQSVGDLAHNLLLRRNNATLRSDLSRLTAELTSGKVQDLGAKTRGDLVPLASLEHSLKLQDSYAITRADVSLALDTAQIALSAARGSVENIGTSLLMAINGQNTQTLDIELSQAHASLNSVVSMFNTQVGEKFVFAGINSDQKPLASADEMLSELTLATATATTDIDFLQAIDDWFNLAGGFDTTGYLGGPPPSYRTKLGSGNAIDPGMTANDAAVRNTLRNLAINALISQGSFSGDDDAIKAVLRNSASGLLAANDMLIEAQGDIGAAQGIVLQSEVQINVERGILLEARNKIISIDPFDTANELEAVQLQMESLYLLTAKTSRLNLTEYLR